MPSLPVLQALLLADQVYQDRNTGKYVICGIFSAIFFTPKESTSEEKSLDASEAPAEEGESHEEDSTEKASDGSAGLGGGAGGGIAGEKDEASEYKPAKPAPVPLARLVKAGSPYAYISMTELRGSRRFELRYVDLEENNVLFSTTFEVSCRDPLETIQITVPLPPLPIPHEGAFVLELLCDSELLGSHRVMARRQQKQ